MSSRAVENKMPRIILMYQPSTDVAQGPCLFTELKSSLMTVVKMSLWWLPATPDTSSLHALWTECDFFFFFATGVHSHIQKQRSQAIVQLQIPQQKEATFCPQRSTSTTGRLHKPQQGLCTGECARCLCIHMHWCISAWCLEQSNTTWASQFFQVFMFLCRFSIVAPPIFPFLFRTEQQGTEWAESLNPGYVYTLIVCNCVWACN